MLEVLDASAVRRWSVGAELSLVRHQQTLDALNVFPVADADTGSNLVMTWRSAQEAASESGAAEAGEVISAMARGAVIGARGNSGVIVAQILRGMAEALQGVEVVDAGGLKKAWRNGADSAYAVVATPVEGTVLSVMRAVATAAERAEDTLVAVVDAGVGAARVALAHTTGQLDALKRAGVVDAGGLGLVVLLDALCGVVTGVEGIAPLPGGVGPAAGSTRPAGADSTLIVADERATPPLGPGYEVQYLLEAHDAALPALRLRLGELGDSLVVAATDDAPGLRTWNVHVHVDDVGAAIEAGVEAGRPHRITVSRFADVGSGGSTAAIGGSTATALVAVAPGVGVADLFAREGVGVVEDPTGSAEILAAIRASGPAAAIVLPNGPVAGAAAERAAAVARAEGRNVAVIPTRSAMQALAAVAVHDPGRRFEDNVIHMAESAAATRWAEISFAAGEALTMAGLCQRGDVLGLIGGEVVTIGSRVDSVAEAVIDLLLSVGGELVTVLLGAAAPTGIQPALARHVRGTAPHVELAFLRAGQPDHPLLIGVE